jgi:transposase InsO family protein
MNSVTQDMKFRQSLMIYAQKYGVSRASRKYNKSRSFIYFWMARYDGTLESLACRSRRPHSHPNQHTPAELKLIRDMRRRNPDLGMIELWSRLKKRGYTRCPESLFRVMRRMGMFPESKPKKKYQPKPYEQMTHPGERIQIDVKVVPKRCIADPELRLFQYTAIDEFSRLRFLAAYPEQSTYSSADFLKRAVEWFARRGVRVECVQTDNGFEFTNRFSPSKKHLLTLFEATAAKLHIRHKLIRPYTPRHNGKVERSHREDQKRFYDKHHFYSLADFENQLSIYLRRSNNMPMRPLHWLSPSEFLHSHTGLRTFYWTIWLIKCLPAPIATLLLFFVAILLGSHCLRSRPMDCPFWVLWRSINRIQFQRTLTRVDHVMPRIGRNNKRITIRDFFPKIKVIFTTSHFYKSTALLDPYKLVKIRVIFQSNILPCFDTH